MNIYIDFDDTITNSIQALLAISNRRYGTSYKIEDVGDWNFKDIYPNIPLKEIVSIYDTDEFYNLLSIKRDALFVLRRFAKRNKIFIVTKVNKKSMVQKFQWIKEHIQNFGIDVELIGIPLNKSKGIVDMSEGIMIDDNVKFLNETNAKYKILFKNNRRFDELQEWSGMSATSWQELEKILYNIISKEKGITNGKI